MITNNFIQRHNGPKASDLNKMLETIGVKGLDELINQTIPAAIRLEKPLNLGQGMNEYEYLEHLRKLGSRNKIYRTYIGMGYYNTILPGVIQRNILENPGWYTSYTPYQAEISQGRLEALLNFQTMVSDLTGMPISNSSLLDEATAAAEAMIMAYNSRSRNKVKANAHKFFVSNKIFPQTLDLLKTRSAPLGIELVIGCHEEFTGDETFFGGIIQYPDGFGQINDYKAFVEKMHALEGLVVVATDLMSLVLLTPPGEWGADIVVGSSQRFGVPMGYGGPHAAFLATKEEFKRNMPGRIIGISKDAEGKPALRMALQTREQHIKREKATSNICTAQALLAIMAGMYAVYHGADGLRKIARNINVLTGVLAAEVEKYGYRQLNTAFFDTLKIELPASTSIDRLRALALEQKINFRYIDEKNIGISLDETTSLGDVNLILCVLAQAAGRVCSEYICKPAECEKIETFPATFKRTSDFLTHPVFNTYHSETSMMRYIKKLENRDLALNRTMIPLGSCTMKLNAAVEMFALSWPEFNALHPFVPEDQAEGYHQMINEMDRILSEITGFAKVSFQPNSGANGEYTGLLIIRQYHLSRGEGQRNVCLIPSSAHGTNPASAHMAGMEVVVVKCDENGNIDITDLKAKAEQYKDRLAALMVTYPSTHGVFEEEILEIVDTIHQYGGQVYMDGANMNAQVGLTSPGRIGADVCHLNLHKTFAIPHGGGGPGVGPVGVAAHLVPFLPGHPVVKTGGEQAITPVAAAPFGSPLVLTISYGYLKLMGGQGLTDATRYAILNANYLKARLEKHYKILYTGKNGRVAHEMILDCNKFMQTANVQVIDIAKRLMDYGFHAPTVAFPVHGTLMVEPTESEPIEELDRLAEALIKIREEIAAIENGQVDKQNNLIRNAPHTAAMVIKSSWDKPYSREEAAFPLPGMEADKYFPPVARIDDAYGDRNLICTCQVFDSEAYS
ncbi:MAG: glycine dehydrogenase [Bacteroidales bacterium]|jgi:glycine dehydrogenase|nr:glycine dehydrogenase [Bacteroidales bacterium]MDN5329049.1 glycine dehydrogenase [Bacteroidales bacterium]